MQCLQRIQDAKEKEMKESMQTHRTHIHTHTLNTFARSISFMKLPFCVVAIRFFLSCTAYEHEQFIRRKNGLFIQRLHFSGAPQVDKHIRFNVAHAHCTVRALKEINETNDIILISIGH